MLSFRAASRALEALSPLALAARIGFVVNRAARSEITPGDVCVRCGSAVHQLGGPEGTLEAGVDMAPSRSVTDGSLEGGVDLAPPWGCECGGIDGPQVPDR